MLSFRPAQFSAPPAPLLPEVQHALTLPTVHPSPFPSGPPGLPASPSLHPLLRSKQPPPRETHPRPSSDSEAVVPTSVTSPPAPAPDTGNSRPLLREEGVSRRKIFRRLLEVKGGQRFLLLLLLLLLPPPLLLLLLLLLLRDAIRTHR